MTLSPFPGLPAAPSLAASIILAQLILLRRMEKERVGQ
jgi:hypothetical protein